MWDIFKAAVWIIVILAIAIAVALGLTAVFMNATYKECAEGFFWSYKEMACLPGYKP